MALLLAACPSTDDAGADGTTSGSTGAEPTTGSPISTSTAPATTDDGTTTTSPPATDTSADSTGDGPCTSHDDCTDPDLPGCSTAGECVGCGQVTDPTAACLSRNDGFDTCVDNRCVECTADDDSACEGTTPACDLTLGECVPCTRHDQCGASGCNLDAGTCLPTDNVWHVGPGLCPGFGSVTSPFCDIQDAIAAVGVANEGTIWVSAGNTYQESLGIAGGQTIAIIGEDATPPRVQPPNNGQPTLHVQGASTTVYLENFELRGNNSSPGVHVDAATFVAQRCRIAQNRGGLTASNGAVVAIENSFVNGDNDQGPAVDNETSTVSVVYSTLLQTANFGGNPVISCGNAISTSVRNSLVVNYTNVSGPEIECAGILVENTAEETTTTPDLWFAAYNVGDLHLTTEGADHFADIGVWQNGDPYIDVDNEPRVAVDGAMEHAGADVP